MSDSISPATDADNLAAADLESHELAPQELEALQLASDEFVSDEHSPGVIEAEPANAATPSCAKCGAFDDWGAASWCPVCGFYPKFDKAPEKIDDSLQVKTEEQSVNFVRMLKTLPKWANVLIGGSLSIIVASIAIRISYAYSGRNPGTWAVCQLMIGILMALVAHCRAAFIGLNKDQKLAPMDIVMAPFATWDRTIKELPFSRVTIWLGGWGITVVLSAVIIVGGIRYSAIFDDWGFQSPESNDIITVTRGHGGGAKKKMKSLLDKELVILPPAPEGPFVKCIAYGYFRGNNTKQFCHSVLFAGSLNGEFVHIATIDYSDMPKDKRGRLAVMLKERNEDEPFFSSSYNSTFVEPSIVCKVNYAAMESNGRLRSPQFESVAMDLRKERAFAQLKEKGDFSQLIGRLNVEKYDTEYNDRMEQYEATCAKIIALHTKEDGPGAGPQSTFEGVADALAE